jgi:hypothetical protein
MSGIALLDWLDEKNCPADWSEKRCHKLSFPCESAAMQGKLEDLKQARSVGFRWGNTYMWAAYCGHLEVLRWASENGCPWDTQARIEANNWHSSNVELMTWLDEKDAAQSAEREAERAAEESKKAERAAAKKEKAYLRAAAERAMPDFLLDVIPDFAQAIPVCLIAEYAIYNLVIVETDVLAHINTLSGQARDAFVRRLVGERAWGMAHAVHDAFKKAESDGHSPDVTDDVVAARIAANLLQR